MTVLPRKTPIVRVPESPLSQRLIQTRWAVTRLQTLLGAVLALVLSNLVRESFSCLLIRLRIVVIASGLTVGSLN